MPKLLPFPIAALFGLTDEQAMARIQAGEDEEAFSRLVQRWEEPIRRLCTRMTGDQHLGQDLTQETFTRVYLHRNAYRAGAKFSTWLWRIALNQCHDELRRQRRRSKSINDDAGAMEALLEDAADTECPAPDVAAQQLEAVRLVRDALQRLPETYRAVLILRHYENLKFREIAEVLDIPEGTVKSRMTEALSQLSRILHPVASGPTTDRPSAPPASLQTPVLL